MLKDAGINYTFTAMAAKDLADAGSDTPADFIFRTYMGLVHGMESRHYPPFYLGNAQTIPSHNLAAAFPAKNGYPITDSRSLYDEQDPYLIARDNRFNMNLYYQGKNLELITQTLMYLKVEKIQRVFTFMPVVRDIIYLSSCLLHKKICWIQFKH